MSKTYRIVTKDSRITDLTIKCEHYVGDPEHGKFAAATPDDSVVAYIPDVAYFFDTADVSIKADPKGETVYVIFNPSLNLHRKEVCPFPLTPNLAAGERIVYDYQREAA